MKTKDTDRMVQEIVNTINLNHKRADAPSNAADGPDFDSGFEMLIEDEDETGRAVMRQILHALQEG